MCFCEGKDKIDDSIMKVKSKDMLIELMILIFGNNVSKSNFESR